MHRACLAADSCQWLSGAGGGRAVVVLQGRLCRALRGRRWGMDEVRGASPHAWPVERRGA
ncbi:hypothetical protein E2C01_004358 [Portunus trituberculatus]|uniref:Uncharacterized protein n=1 Tax=Portunus trituberculatus TaxID=210409 RepID=A0A5B7CPP1_PORTR|nr:hypothetical protein [Portunus trituberculatus]